MNENKVLLDSIREGRNELKVPFRTVYLPVSYTHLDVYKRQVRAMDVLFPKIGEIIGGSEREADYNKLMTRIEERCV